MICEPKILDTYPKLGQKLKWWTKKRKKSEMWELERSNFILLIHTKNDHIFNILEIENEKSKVMMQPHIIHDEPIVQRTSNSLTG